MEVFRLIVLIFHLREGGALKIKSMYPMNRQNHFNFYEGESNETKLI